MISNNMYLLLGIMIALLFLWTAAGYFFERSVAEPKYSILEQAEGYEIRQYEPAIVAQVTVTGPYVQALRSGFTILADYIFGNNTQQTSLAMTAPVTEEVSEKLAMTAPVTEYGDDQLRVVSFVMPANYTLETLPQPRNSAIEIVPQPEKKVAALSFSWFRGSERVARKKEKLVSLLARDGITARGIPRYAGYNAPFTAPWLNRNEILIDID